MSLWNGIVMGGGVGLSIYGDFRVATGFFTIQFRSKLS